MLDQIIILGLLLLLSGFFSSAETALFSISRAKAKHLAKGDNRVDRLIKRMKDDSHKLLTTILIGNNLVNIGASAMATAIAMDYFKNNAVGIATGIMTLLILVFGEILPKSAATKNNLLIARLVIFPIYWLSILFLPVIAMLNFIPKLTGKIKKTPIATEEELITMVEAVEEEGEIREEEKELIHNIFKLDDISASEIMTPTTDIFSIEVDGPLPLREIIKSGYTRIPVADGNIDNIVGIVNVKDILAHNVSSIDKIDVRKIMTNPYFIPETKKIDKLLHEFQKSKNHISIVVSEHGEVIGLVTLEDVLEVLVGDIEDETDIVKPRIIKIKNNEWIVPGRVGIEDVNKKINMMIPESYEYDTFSGYILWKLGRIPEDKERVDIEGFSIVVKEKGGNRIISLLIKRKPPEQASDTSPDNEKNGE